MAEKRKDNKGRILRPGESQRPDKTYQYRYRDIRGNYHYVYAATLSELREKEIPIQQSMGKGIDYSKGNINVIELVNRYIATKQGVRYNTEQSYTFVTNLLKKEDFGYKKINTIKTSDAKLWFIKLQSDGRRYSTIELVRGVVRPAFQMAVDDDTLLKNPFAFRLSGVVTNDTERRDALTVEQQDAFMEFVRNDTCYGKYYDEFTVLLGTGLRASELCGLTLADLDFQNRKITVTKQIRKEKGGTYHIDKPKTNSGVRCIPMSDDVAQSLRNIVNKRPKSTKEVMIDGYTGFLLLTRDGLPMTVANIERHLLNSTNKYRKKHSDEPLPNITPHVLRHTFCTNMASMEMPVQDLQYIMGHSDPSITLGVYTHGSYQNAEKSMKKILQFQPTQMQGMG